ncbi:uncharacterized protein LOC141850812 [Brevipalpus obovatus]|uniref:uncharacterized protein LOC141850812 n=1 Tax=Brevipalpus obovatus TaxID=246614 RepID=UPI003D9DF337
MDSGKDLKVLVPVTAAVATAKKHNQRRQILVVPTPGGGARLAAFARPITLLRSGGGRGNDSNESYRSNSSPTASPSNSIHNRSPRPYTDSRLSNRNLRGGGVNVGRSNSSSTDGRSYHHHHHHSHHYSLNSGYNNGPPDPSQLLRQQQLHQKQLREKYLRMKREEEAIPEWKRKEDYFAALGLVTKQTLKEIQNKKCERKRRTTANPQFSNAAIEAKRITAMEVAAKRAKRKEMAAAEKNPAQSRGESARGERSSSRIPLMPSSQTSICSLMRPSINKNNPNTSNNNQQPAIKSTSLVSNSSNLRQRQILSSNNNSTNMLHDRPRNHPFIQRFRVKNRFPDSMSPSTIGTNNSSPNPRPFSSSSSLISAPFSTNVSSQTNFIRNNIVIWSRVALKCTDCSEQCDPSLEAIVHCKDCRCYFHATCVSDVDDINASDSVPCPSCDKRILLKSNQNDFDSPIDGASRIRLDNVEESAEPDDDIDMGYDGSLKADQNDGENLIRKSMGTRSSSSTDSKRNLPQELIEKKEILMDRNYELSRVLGESEAKRSQLSTHLQNIREDNAKLVDRQNKVREKIQKVNKVITTVTHWDIEKGEAVIPDNIQEIDLNPPEINLTCNERKNNDFSGESESDQSFDSSSESSGESNDDEDENDGDQPTGPLEIAHDEPPVKESSSSPILAKTPLEEEDDVVEDSNELKISLPDEPSELDDDASKNDEQSDMKIPPLSNESQALPVNDGEDEDMDTIEHDKLVVSEALESNDATEVPSETIYKAKSQENESLPDQNSPTIPTIDGSKLVENNELAISPASVPSNNSPVAKSEHLYPGQTVPFGEQGKPSSETDPSEDFLSGLNVKQSNDWGEQDETSAAVASIQDLEGMDAL